MMPILAALLLGAMPGPLVCSAPSVDRGEVRTGPLLIHKYELLHGGSGGILTIAAAESGCGCLKPTLTQTVLRPGERTELTVVVNTLTQPPGSHVWRTRIRYQVAPEAGTLAPGPATEGEIEVQLAARLIQEVSVTPPTLAISTSGPTAQTLTVTDRRPQPLTIRNVTTTNPHLRAQLQPAVSEGGIQTQKVDLKLGADYPPGVADETVVLLTTDPACPELRIPVRITKQMPGALLATPSTLEVRFAPGQEEASSLVQLRRPGGGTVRLQAVESDDPGVRVKWSQGAGPVATVRVIVDHRRASPAGQATLRVLVAEGAASPVLIPVIWSRPDPGRN